MALGIKLSQVEFDADTLVGSPAVHFAIGGISAGGKTYGLGVPKDAIDVEGFKLLPNHIPYGSSGSVVASLDLPNDALLARSGGIVTGLVVPPNQVVANTGAGLAPITFSSFKTALNITGTDLNLPQDQFFIGSSLGKATPTQKGLIPLDGFGLAAGQLVVGNVSNIAESRPPATISLTQFAPPTSDYGLGVYTFTTSKVSFGPNDLINRAGVEALIVGGGSPINPSAITLSSQNLIIGDVTGLGMAIPKSSLNIAGFALPSGFLVRGDLAGIAQAVLPGSIPLNSFGALSADYSLGSFTFSSTKSLAAFAANDLVTRSKVEDIIANTPAAPPLLTALNLSTGNFVIGDGAGKASETTKGAIPAAGFALPLNNIVVGNASGIAVNTPLSSLSIPPNGAVTGLDVTLNNIIVGDNTNKGSLKALNTLTLNSLAPVLLTADAAVGAFTFTSTKANGAFGTNDLVTKSYVLSVTPTVSRAYGNAVSGQMNLISLPTEPKDLVQSIQVFFRGVLMRPTIDYTVTGTTGARVITATQSFNEDLGGTGTDGLAFSSADWVDVRYFA